MSGPMPAALPHDEARPRPPGVSFDTRKLDTLMAEVGLDILLVTSKHNVGYLLGGYRFFFYSAIDAHGLSRYLPILIYIRGAPELTTYVASPMEQYEAHKLWPDTLRWISPTTEDAARAAVDEVRRLRVRPGRIGVEMGFLPADAYRLMADAFGADAIVNATFTLELLRAVKTPTELARLRNASEEVVEAMLSVFAAHGEGATKIDIARALRREEERRGLDFDYCLINMGTDPSRAPSEQAWRPGEVLALDSGGNDGGYIGDLCRMAVLGDADAELHDLLAEIDAVQQAARQPIRAGTPGQAIFAAAEPLVERSAHRGVLDFAAHGMGIVSHEAPWLSDHAAVPYPGYHADRPLEAGMVISIETTLKHPRRGFIKLEDTVAVTETGCEGFGDGGREWNHGRRS